MTIAYRGGGQNANASADSTNITMSTTAVENDYLVATAAWDASSGTVTWPSGFTQRGILNSTVNGGSSAWADKIAGASEPSSYTISENSGSTSIAAGVVAYSGVDTTTPRDVTPTALLSPSDSDPYEVIATGVATGTANRWLVHIGSVDQNGGGAITASPPSATPATWTERVDISDGVWSNISINDCTDTAGTHTSNVTSVHTSPSTGSGGPMGFLIALRPATAGSLVTQEMTLASFGFSAQVQQNAVRVLPSVAALSFAAQAQQNAARAETSLAAANMLAQGQQNALQATTTLAAVTMTAQDTQNRLDTSLTLASMSFSVWALTTSLVGTIRTRWKTIVGVVRGVIQNDEDR